jgi:glyoxylase-like metal-dependent hydrolase (beta-lactamase superfamily II)
MAYEITTIKLGITNCFLIRSASNILIDAGGPNMVRKFLVKLDKLAVRPTDIDLIIITHGHWDHIGSASEIKDATRARIMMCEQDARLLENAEVVIPPALTPWGRVLTFLGGAVSSRISFKPAKVDMVVREPEISLSPFGLDAKVIRTPGHTPGSLCVLLNNGEILAGDMAMNGPPLTWGPRLPIFAQDIDRVKRSWERLKEMGAKTVFPSHGKPFDIRRLSLEG